MTSIFLTPVFIIAINTFREVVRNKVLYGVFAFALLLLAISALFGSVSIGDRVLVIKDFGLFSLSFCGAIFVLVSGVSLLERELKQKTIYNILSKPVHRSEFIIGKFIGLAITGALLIVMMGLIFILFTAFFEGHFDKRLFQGLYLVVCEMTLLSAVTIFFSSLVVTTTLVGIFALGVYIVGHSLVALDYFLTKGDNSPFIQTVVKLLRFSLPNLSLFNATDMLLYGAGVSGPYLVFCTAYALLYSAIAVLLAVAIFRLRELQ